MTVPGEKLLCSSLHLTEFIQIKTNLVHSLRSLEDPASMMPTLWACNKALVGPIGIGYI